MGRARGVEMASRVLLVTFMACRQALATLFLVMVARGFIRVVSFLIVNRIGNRVQGVGALPLLRTCIWIVVTLQALPL